MAIDGESTRDTPSPARELFTLRAEDTPVLSRRAGAVKDTALACPAAALADDMMPVSFAMDDTLGCGVGCGV
jgi:hypothetical protein